MALALARNKICRILVESKATDHPLRSGEWMDDLEWDALDRPSRAPRLSQRKNIARDGLKGCRVVLSGAKKRDSRLNRPKSAGTYHPDRRSMS